MSNYKYSGLTRLTTPTNSFVTYYSKCKEFAELQQDTFWPAKELGLKKDLHSVRTELNEAELHGLLFSQAILAKLEVIVGNDYWTNFITKAFPRPEVVRMATCFANVEMSSHGEFYIELNRLLGNDTDDYYESFNKDKFLKERFEFIHSFANSNDELVASAALALIEGVVLFSVFGFFVGFNRNGFNFIPSFCAGIAGSIRDENLHSTASAYLHNTLLSELENAGVEVDKKELQNEIAKMAIAVYRNEVELTKRLFAINGNRVVAYEDVISFIEDRLNICLARLNMPKMFDKEPGKISSWFYTNASTLKHSDFFSGTQLEYRRNWKRYELVFVNEE